MGFSSGPDKQLLSRVYSQASHNIGSQVILSSHIQQNLENLQRQNHNKNVNENGTRETFNANDNSTRPVQEGAPAHFCDYCSSNCGKARVKLAALADTMQSVDNPKIKLHEQDTPSFEYG